MLTHDFFKVKVIWHVHLRNIRFTAMGQFGAVPEARATAALLSVTQIDSNNIFYMRYLGQFLDPV